MSSQVRIFNFTAQRKFTSAISLVLLTISLFSLFTNGLKYGLEFTGGTQIELSYSVAADLELTRNVLEDFGYLNHQVVNYGSGSDVLIRIQDPSLESGGTPASSMGDRLVEELQLRSGQEVRLQRLDYLGSVVGEELREQAGLGLLTALGAMMVYVAQRFQFKFAVATVVALAEDLLLTLGFISLTQMDFDLTVLAALMAVIGYGLNDTIVICDRIRDNFRKLRNLEPDRIIDISLSQTMGRTLVTSITTLLVLIFLATLGGDAIRGFAVALMVGVLVSIYSSVFVATGAILSLKIKALDLMVPAPVSETGALAD